MFFSFFEFFFAFFSSWGGEEEEEGKPKLQNSFWLWRGGGGGRNYLPKPKPPPPLPSPFPLQTGVCGSMRCPTSNCRHGVLLVPLAIGRNIWTPLSPSQELARGGACSGAWTSSRSSGPWETCRKSAASCSIYS